MNFSRVADPSGGNLSVASTPTDANGNAEVKYFSGAQSTPSGAVVLDAVVADTPAVTGQTTLTVNQSALFIALGTGNEIASVNNGTSYQKLWTAYVTDSTGAAVPRVTLTVSALPTYYLKGTFAWDGKKWSSVPYPVLTNSSADLSTEANDGQYFKCANEDTDYTGIVTLGKDINSNGKLEPGNVISVSGGASVTTVQTDDSGFAIITLQYAESYAFWVGVDLRVSATVSGTESTNDAFFLAPGLSTDYTVETLAPAGQTSPFGVIASCTNRN